MIKSLIFFLALLPSTLFAASEEDIDRLTTYSVIVGRAAACGIETTPSVKKISAWIDRRFLESERNEYKQIFLFGMMYHGKEQQDGKSPDSCASVKNTWGKMKWP